MSVYLVPVGVGCHDVDFVGVSFSFLCLAFFLLFWVLVYMVLGVGV